jgi:hypothetical protein
MQDAARSTLSLSRFRHQSVDSQCLSEIELSTIRQPINNGLGIPSEGRAKADFGMKCNDCHNLETIRLLRLRSDVFIIGSLWLSAAIIRYPASTGHWKKFGANILQMAALLHGRR